MEQELHVGVIRLEQSSLVVLQLFHALGHLQQTTDVDRGAAVEKLIEGDSD